VVGWQGKSLDLLNITFNQVLNDDETVTEIILRHKLERRLDNHRNCNCDKYHSLTVCANRDVFEMVL
jgi:hypothetical protein